MKPEEANTRAGGIKFQIEHVEEAEPPVDAIWPPVTEDDDRVLTADAVPMTAYYRGNESSHGRVRPSLVDLHEGRYGQQLDSVSEEVRLFIILTINFANRYSWPILLIFVYCRYQVI